MFFFLRHVKMNTQGGVRTSRENCNELEKSLRTGDLRDTEDLTTTLHPYFMKPCMRTDDQAFGVT